MPITHDKSYIHVCITCVTCTCAGKCVRSIPSKSGLRSIHVFAALNTVVLSFAEKNEVRATAAVDAIYPWVIT